MRVMSYNIHHGVALNGENTLEKIGNLIFDLDISICLIQELDFANDRSSGVDQLDYLSCKTGLPYKAYGKNITYKNGYYGNGILSRFELSNITNTVFPAKGIGTKEDVGGGSHKPEDRGVLKANFILNDTLVTLAVTHSSMWEEERRESNFYLSQILKSHTSIVGGDFNTFDREELSVLLPFKSFPDIVNTYPSSKPVYPIDIFFSNSLTVNEYFTLDLDYSDHLPLVVEIDQP